jgi:hypothetical protein
MAQSYKPLIAEMFLAGRGITGKLAEPGSVDLSETPSIEAPVTLEGLVGLVEKARGNNAWAIILFHGVGGDYIPVPAEVHEGFIKYLAENRKTVYTDTFGAIAGIIKK